MEQPLSFALIEDDLTASFEQTIRSIYPDAPLRILQRTLIATYPFEPGSVILIGPTIPADTWEELVTDMSADLCGPVVVVLPSERSPDLRRAVKSGAHAVAYADVSADRIRKAVEMAIANWAARVKLQQSTDQERVTNFPWLLELVAKNLESVAEEVREIYGDEEPPHSFHIKRAIANAFGRLSASTQK